MEDSSLECGKCATAMVARHDEHGNLVHAAEDITMVVADCPECRTEGRISWRVATLAQTED